jgi:hypothetical protein
MTITKARRWEHQYGASNQGDKWRAHGRLHAGRQPADDVVTTGFASRNERESIRSPKRDYTRFITAITTSWAFWWRHRGSVTGVAGRFAAPNPFGAFEDQDCEPQLGAERTATPGGTSAPGRVQRRAGDRYNFFPVNYLQTGRALTPAAWATIVRRAGRRHNEPFTSTARTSSNSPRPQRRREWVIDPFLSADARARSHAPNPGRTSRRPPRLRWSSQDNESSSFQMTRA